MADKHCEHIIPRACAESFADIRQSLGRLESVAEATHAQTTKTNECVGELFASASRHSVELARLQTQVHNIRDRQSEADTLARKVLAAGWKVAVMLAGVVASILGVRQIIN